MKRHISLSLSFLSAFCLLLLSWVALVGTDTATAQPLEMAMINGDVNTSQAFAAVMASAVITANDDTYATDEDVPIFVDAASGLLANDVYTGAGTLAAFTNDTPTFGSVSLAPDGSFFYDPPLNANGIATFTYQATILEDPTTMVAYWRLDDLPSPTAHDYSGNGHIGTLENGPLWVEDTAPTPFPNSYALSLDGLDDYVSIPDDDALDFGPNDDFTVALWVNIPFFQIDTGFIDNSIVQKWSVSGGYPFVISYLNNTAGANEGRIQVARYDGTNVPVMNSISTVNDNQYHHIAFVKDGGTLHLYIDGVLENSAVDTTTFDTSNNSPLFLGRRGTGTNRFFGLLDDVRIYDRGLSAVEVLELVEGSGNLATAVVTITVNPVADPIIAMPDSYNLLRNNSLTVNAPGVLANDSNPDGGTLTAVLNTTVTSGTLSLNSNGSFIYTPTLNFCDGTDSFTYHANNGSADSNIVTATLHVACGTPIAMPDVYIGTEEMPIQTSPIQTITTLFGADLNSNGNMFDITANSNDILITRFDANLSGAQNVEVWYKVGSYVGSETTPSDWTFLGSASVTGLGLNIPTPIPIGGLTIPAGTTYALYIKSNNFVNYTLGANTFSNADLSLSLGVGVSGSWGGVFSPRTWNGTIHYTLAPSVLYNDSDPEGDPLTAVLDSGPSNGLLDLNLDGNFIYTPTINFCGTDHFTYYANDGSQNSNPVTVTLNLACVNDTPIAYSNSYTTAEDITLNVPAPGVTGNDVDVDGDSLTAVLDTNVTTGTLNLNSNGSFTYTPPENWFGTTSFSYHAHDGQVGSNTAVVTLTVTAVNDAPIANDDTDATDEDTAINITVLDNDTDVEGDSLTVTAVSTPANGSTSTNGTTVTYTPTNLSANYTAVFTYTISDGSLTDSATVTVSVTADNDPPIANDDTDATDEDIAIHIAVLDNDTDVDASSLTVTAVSTPANGSTSTDGTMVTYTPVNLMMSYTAVFTYTISDGSLTDTATITVSITADNDTPTAVDDTYSVNEDSSDNTLTILDNDSDPDEDDFRTLWLVGTPNQGGTAVISLIGNTILYTPALNFVGTETFTYTIYDMGGLTDTATVTIDVDNENDAPTAVDDSYTINENSDDNAFNVLGNDSDIDVGDSLTISEVGSAANGTAVISGTTILYTPAPNFVGTDTFTYTIEDLGGLMDTATVSVMVEPVNDAPTAVDDSYTVDEDSEDNAFNVLDNDSDIDGDSLMISEVGSAANGTAVISGTTILYTPTPNFVGTDTFTYTISDGIATSTATVSVTVEDVPDETGFVIYLPLIAKP